MLWIETHQRLSEWAEASHRSIFSSAYHFAPTAFIDSLCHVCKLDILQGFEWAASSNL